MKRAMLATVVALFVSMCAYSVLADKPPTSQPTATLKVTITDLRNDKGQLIYAVFKSADGFPNDEKKSVEWEIRETKDGNKVFTCQLPPGKYGATVLHDENNSNDMDTGAFGVPKEGYGVTNNPKPRMRQATFKDATFELTTDGAEMTISVQYF